jgi:hypothetical protein
MHGKRNRRTKHWTEVLDRRALTWKHFLLALGQCGRYRKEWCGITWKTTYIVMFALIVVVRALSHSVKTTMVLPWFGRNRFVVPSAVVRLNLTIPVSLRTQSGNT